MPNILTLQLYNVVERTRICTLGTEEGQIFTLHFPRIASRRNLHHSLLACGSSRGSVIMFDLHYDDTGNESDVCKFYRLCTLKSNKDTNSANPVFSIACGDKV